jgi:hypothetical protein
MKDIYTRIQGEDPDFVPNKLETNNKLVIYLQQIKTVLNVEEGSVMGALDMYIGLNDMVFDIGVTEKDVQKTVIEKLSRYCPLFHEFDTKISTRFYQGTKRDIMITDIYIDGKKQLEMRHI